MNKFSEKARQQMEDTQRAGGTSKKNRKRDAKDFLVRLIGLFTVASSANNSPVKATDVMEDQINQTALGGDEEGLTVALSEYRNFFREMVKAYEHKGTLPLFEGRANE